MNLENDLYASYFDDPMVQEVTENGYDASDHYILADSILRSNFESYIKLMPQDTLLVEHFKWLLKTFPEITIADEYPNPWVWLDLIVKVNNVGSLVEAEKCVNSWIVENQKIAYWTGGLQFTRNHYEVGRILLDKGYKLIVGVEPWVYGNDKKRMSLGEEIVPVSLWSKFFKDSGFVFVIPRPLPEEDNQINQFYENLYCRITKGRACIVVDANDRYADEKKKRGNIVLVPHFNYPSTSQIFKDYIEKLA